MVVYNLCPKYFRTYPSNEVFFTKLHLINGKVEATVKSMEKLIATY